MIKKLTETERDSGEELRLNKPEIVLKLSVEYSF